MRKVFCYFVGDTCVLKWHIFLVAKFKKEFFCACLSYAWRLEEGIDVIYHFPSSPHILYPFSLMRQHPTCTMQDLQQIWLKYTGYSTGPRLSHRAASCWPVWWASFKSQLDTSSLPLCPPDLGSLWSAGFKLFPNHSSLALYHMQS